MPDLPQGKGLQYLKHDRFPTFCLKEETEEGLKKKKDAADVALEEMRKMIKISEVRTKKNSSARSLRSKKQMCDEDCDSDDPMYHHTPYADMVHVNKSTNIVTQYSSTFETLKKWAKALPFNLLFMVGFEVQGLHPNDAKNCYCPCGPKMKDWRRQFGLGQICEANDQCGNNRKMQPSALIAHLQAKYINGAGGYIHGLIELYIRELSKDRNNGHENISVASSSGTTVQEPKVFRSSRRLRSQTGSTDNPKSAFQNY